jgi:hypothetical protein
MGWRRNTANKSAISAITNSQLDRYIKTPASIKKSAASSLDLKRVSSKQKNLIKIYNDQSAFKRKESKN